MKIIPIFARLIYDHVKEPMRTCLCLTIRCGLSFVLLCVGVWPATVSRAASFGMSDPQFLRPQFKHTEFPGRVISDGKGGLLWTFVNGGSLEGANGQRLGGVIRTLESGVVDTNVSVGPLFPSTRATAVQSDGKILVAAGKAGDFDLNGIQNYHIVRLLPDGALDISYQSPVFDTLLRVITLQADAKLIVGGAAETARVGNGGIINTVRLNSDGSLDNSFSAPVIAGGANQIIFAPPAIDSAGRTLLGGNFTTVNGANYSCLVRLLSNGTVDSSFVQSGYTFLNSTMVRGIVVQTDGKIVIGGGRFRVTGSGTTNYALLRLNTDGSLDTTFTRVPADTAGFVGGNRIRMLRQTADGKFIGVGTTMARFNADGSLDNSFTRLPYWDNYLQSPGECVWFELLSNGKLAVPTGVPLQAGATQLNGAFRLNSDGTLDSSFNSPVFQSEAFPPDARVLPGGKLLVWGTFDMVSGASRRGVARLNPDGTLDSTYNFNAFNDVQSVNVAAPAPDNSLYAFLGRGADPVFDVAYSLAHITASGQLDVKFQPTLDIPFSFFIATALFAQNDGKLIAGWNNEQEVVDGRFSLYRLNPDGSIDPSFAGRTNALGSVKRDASGHIISVTVDAIQILATFPDGKLCAVRSRDATNFFIARLNTDGTEDTNFTAPNLVGTAPIIGNPFITDPQDGSFYQVTALYSGISPVLAAQVLGDGSVLIAGAFRQIGGQNIAGLARLQPNGVLDPTFPGGNGAGFSSNPSRAARVDSVQLDALGPIWITGNFDRFNGVPVKGIAPLDSNGSVDTAFASQGSFYDYSLADTRSSSVALGGDGGIFLLGPFRLANDRWPYAVNRLIEYGPPTLNAMEFYSTSGLRLSASLVEGQVYRLQTSTNLREWADFRTLTGLSSPVVVDDSDAKLLSRRFYRIITP